MADLYNYYIKTVNDILTDPQEYKKYRQDMAKYAWEQA